MPSRVPVRVLRVPCLCTLDVAAPPGSGISLVTRHAWLPGQATCALLHRSNARTHDHSMRKSLLVLLVPLSCACSGSCEHSSFLSNGEPTPLPGKLDRPVAPARIHTDVARSRKVQRRVLAASTCGLLLPRRLLSCIEASAGSGAWVAPAAGAQRLR